MLVKNTGEGDFEQAPEGNHVARCYSVVNLGLVEQGGQYPGIKHKLRWSFELCNEKMSDGRPFSVSEHLTASLGSKAILHQRLVSWRGKPFTSDELEGFDLRNVLGHPCLINVVHNKSKDGTKTYTNVAGITPLPKGMDAPPLINELLYFDFDRPVETLPEWLQKMIGENPDKPEENGATMDDTAAAQSFEQALAEIPDGFDDNSIPF